MATLALAGHDSTFVGAFRSLSKRTNRETNQLAVVEGRPSVEYALRIGQLTQLAVSAEASEQFADLIDLADAAGVDTRAVSLRTLRAISDTSTPQGIVGIARCVYRTELPSTDLMIGLAGLQDPGNVGAVLRCADAFGAGVILGPTTADPRSQKVVRASAGSALAVPMAISSDLSATMRDLRDRGYQVLATAAGASVSLETLPLAANSRVCWLLGSEAHGLAAEFAELCDATVSIGMQGNAESLNVAVSAGICLHWTRHKLG